MGKFHFMKTLNRHILKQNCKSVQIRLKFLIQIVFGSLSQKRLKRRNLNGLKNLINHQIVLFAICYKAINEFKIKKKN